MSNLCKKFKKEIEKKSLRFPCEMYNNVVGSLIITNYILAEDKPELKDIITTPNCIIFFHNRIYLCIISCRCRIYSVFTNWK